MRIPNRSFRGTTAVLLAAYLVLTASTAVAQNEPTDRPTLLTPANQDTLQTSELPVQLTWTAVERATTYEVQVFSSGPAVESLEPIQFKSKVITGTAYVIETAEILGLVDSLGTDTFWWRVRGRNIDGEGLWSNEPEAGTFEDAWRFTILDPPGNPIIVAIPDTTINELDLFTYQVMATDPAGGTLTYALAPDTLGATIDAASGLISWTPTEEQGPGDYPMVVTVTNEQGASASEDVTITVREVNSPPVLTVLTEAQVVIAEGDTIVAPINELLTLDADATDSDIPENTLTFSLSATTAPADMSIDPGTGVIGWTPPSVGVFPVTVVVDDNGLPIESDSVSFFIDVSQDEPPEFTAIPDTTILEEVPFTLQVEASDAEGGDLVYSLAPDTLGLSIGAESGLMSWTPSEEQGEGVYEVFVTATDIANLSATDTLIITVLEVNRPPVLEIADTSTNIVADGDTISLGNEAIGTALTLNASATDPDIPENNLSYSFVTTPDGFSIDQDGTITWDPVQEGVFVSLTVVVADDGDPVLSDTSSFNIDVSGSIIIDPPDGVCSAQLSWIGSDSVPQYIVEVATDAGFDSIVVVDTVSAVSYQTPGDLDENTLYFWRVSTYDPDTGRKGPPSITDRFSLWPATIPLSHSLSFPKAEVSGDFRMVSLPGESQAVTWPSTFAGQAHESEWRVFRDDSDNEPYSGYLQQYSFDTNPNDPNYVFQPGVGFWAISNSAWTVPSQSVNNVPLNDAPANEEDTFFGIPLNVGSSEADARWTMIGNPYNFELSWDAILEVNGLSGEDVLWYWVGTRYNDEPTMQPYRGYYFFNRTNLSELRIPCIARVAPQAATKKEPLDRALTLALITRDEQGESYTVSDITVGLSKEALETVDNLDRFIPPVFFEDYRLTLSAENLETKYKFLQQEVRPEIGQGQTFDITLRAVPGEQVLLKAEGLQAWMDTEIYLVDRTLGITYDLHAESDIRLEPSEQDSRYQLLVGSPDFIAKAESELVPDAFRLQQNYPNPFTGVTSIEYALPDPEHVVLHVYNVLGQRVRTLVNDAVDAGYHRVAWDGRNDAGEAVASGLYVYVLQAESNQASGRMVLVR